MTQMANVIDQFRSGRIAIYRDHPEQGQLDRDLGGVNETVKDHVGRWPLELIQNSDDANATRIMVCIADSAIYFADSGDGLAPDKLKGLAGTHLPTKAAGAIGRKGLGFKSVYEITSSPSLFTGELDGVLFDPQLARAALHDAGLVIGDRVPHEWLPFWVSRHDAAKLDSVLAELTEWNTVIRLTLISEKGDLASALAVLKSLPPHILLPLRKVERIEWTGTEMNRVIERRKILDEPETWSLSDGFPGNPVSWRVRRKSLPVPPSKLIGLEESDRKRMKEASMLVAAPTTAESLVIPADPIPRICVYYPIGENEDDGRAPLPLLLHADFLVSSDRKQVLSLDKYPLNRWLVRKLSLEIVSFVNSAYAEACPESYLRLLRHRTESDEPPIAARIWKDVKRVAKRVLLLPDISGRRTLKANVAKVIHTSIASKRARLILKSSSLGASLVHHSLEDSDEVRSALRQLDVGRIQDNDLVESIRQFAPSKTSEVGDLEWILHCWNWLAEWVAAKPSGTERKQRIEMVESLPILPIGGKNQSRQSLGNRAVVTWRTGLEMESLPDWLPLRFVDTWFRDQITTLDAEHPVRKLLDDLKVKPPSTDTVLFAFGIAVEQYQSQPAGHPERFLQFLRQRNWHETLHTTPLVQCCPIPVSIGGKDTWRSANTAYFGREWGESHLGNVLDGAPDVAWAKQNEADLSLRQILEWLGVVAYPRIRSAKEESLILEDRLRASRQLPGDDCVVGLNVLIFDHVVIAQLNAQRSSALLQIVANNWDRYYSSLSKSRANIEGPRGGSRFPRDVDARWLYEIKTSLVPPHIGNVSAPLERCWLPDPETSRSVGPLLPTIELNAFGSNRSNVEFWLRRNIGLRTNLNEITIGEWRSILSEQIPKIVGAIGREDKGKRSKVQNWYEAAIDSLVAQQVSVVSHK